MNPAIHSTPLRRHMPEIIVAIGLAVAQFILPHNGISEDLMTRNLIWGLFGLGLELLFGYTGDRQRVGSAETVAVRFERGVRSVMEKKYTRDTCSYISIVIM